MSGASMNNETVENELRRIAQIIGAKSDQLPTVCRLQGGGRPNIEISDEGILSYEAYERGVQIFSYSFTDLDALMYHVFKEVVPQLASVYATEMEANGQDFRKHFFRKKVELMTSVKAEWGKRIEEEQKEELY